MERHGLDQLNLISKKAQKDHNDEQGDAFEGVFARVGRFSNELINCMKKFGNDLEIIPDGEYCLLRRKSIRKACVFVCTA